MTEFNQTTIAMVYDFDKTLSPKDMQAFGIFDFIKVEEKDFWAEVKKERDETKAEELLVYMRKMVKLAQDRGDAFTQEKLKEFGSKIVFFDGVLDWFDRVNDYVSNISNGEVTVEHYIVSSGLRDMIKGSKIADKFKRIYACEFIYEDGKPVWPARIVTDAAKTQYIFRINKGMLDPVDTKINSHMPDTDRAIPFSNLMYLGDSDTDIPSMAVVMKNGGHSVAVYDPEKGSDAKHMEKMAGLKKASRIDFYCPADYSAGSLLEQMIFSTLTVIASRIKLRKSIHSI